MTSTALRFSKTTSGRYAATADGFRYLVIKTGTEWDLTIRPTVTVVDVEIADMDARADWYEFESLKDAKVIANAFHELGNEYKAHENGHQSRFSRAITIGFDRLIEMDAAKA
jgi:hypothetical protein